jgi:hypothetical protein
MAKPYGLAQGIQYPLAEGLFESMGHRANVSMLHPMSPDSSLDKRSDRVEHYKFPLFINEFKDPTYA